MPNRLNSALCKLHLNNLASSKEDTNKNVVKRSNIAYISFMWHWGFYANDTGEAETRRLMTEK
jgi:hypothetical protein